MNSGGCELLTRGKKETCLLGTGKLGVPLVREAKNGLLLYIWR